MPYEKQFGTPHPGLLMILIDQSGSMDAPFENGKSRAEVAALVVNRCIQEIMLKCTSMEKTKDRCFILVFGYGAPTANPKANGEKAYLIVGGKASEVETQKIRIDSFKKKISDGAGGLIEMDYKLGIWVEPCVEGDTPMEAAFSKAEEYATHWVLEHPDNFPPIVINITDGAPNDAADAETAARSLMKIATTDGNLLLFNAHISDNPKTKKLLPASDSELSTPLEKLMFRLSSEIPTAMIDLAKNAGLENAQTGSRGVIINAEAKDLISLVTFGTVKV